MLTALYETDRRDRKGSVIWRCKCDCGNEVDVSYDRLNYSTVVSCGCRKKEFSHKLNGYQTHVVGTSVNILSKKKLRSDNKTGVAGVYLVRGRYRAEICFQQKSYYLGEYAQLETAAAVRQEAEKLLHGNFLSFYEKWKKKAEEDPEWAKENPISVSVKRDGNGDFIVSMLPSFEQEKGTTA